MSVSDLRIELSNSKAVYYSGDKVSGKVICTIEKEKIKINRVRLSIIGYGKVFWYIDTYFMTVSIQNLNDKKLLTRVVQ